MRMRVCWAIAVLAVTSVLSFSSLTARGQVGVRFTAGIQIQGVSDFYDPLVPYGFWVDLPEYGRCWHPNVGHGWMPYTEGHWEWTDCGWYWASDEPWAWATYHYGSWVHSPIRGWLWLPGLEWAPAWVAWRQGPDYIGWAPCGPHGAVPAPSLFWFVDVHHFHDHIGPSNLIINNTAIINRTRVINNITHETRNFDGQRTRVVVNRGPGVAPIQRATGRNFSSRPVRDVVRQEPLPQRLQTEGRVQPWRSQGARFVPDQPRQGRTEQPATTQSAPARQPREQFNERDRKAPQSQPTPPPAVTQPQAPRQPERSLPPTGRERNGAGQENFSQSTPPPAQPTTPAAKQPPPLRERNESRSQPAPPAAQPPSVRERPANIPEPERTLPPGQERKIEQRQEPTPPAQAPEVKPPPTQERPAPVVPERPLPPTGRERQVEPRREVPPGQSKYSEQPENPTGHERGPDRERDKEKP